MVKLILIKSPDEWATTKQACRDELVVYLFFSPIYSSLYFHVLSTVLRISSFTLYTRSKSSLVEHSTIIRNGNIQHQLLNQEIPLPPRSDYLQLLIEKTKQFLRRIGWKAHFFLNPDTASSSKETYGFKSTKNPPPIEELKDFENDMLKMIQSVKFMQVNNPFLNIIKLKEDADRIKNEPKLLIAADKTTNFYKLEPSTYNDLLEKNITKSYKKAQPETTQAIHKENKAIATKLKIDDRVDTTADKAHS